MFWNLWLICFYLNLAKCGLKIYDRNQGAFTDPNFNPDNCGQTCGGSYEGTTMFYCEKDEVCCPSGPSDQSCSKTCGPFDPRGNHFNSTFLGLHSVYHSNYIYHKKLERCMWNQFITESFGECGGLYGSCSRLCLADAPCHIECKRDQHCRYGNWVFSRTSK